jgi:transposase
MAVHQKGSQQHVVSPQPVNGTSFASFITGLPYEPNTVLLLDNASIHKTNAVKNAARDRGFELLFLPPYSPEFNPIELVFGVAKQHFYKSRYADSSTWSLDDSVQRSVKYGAKAETIVNCFIHAYGLITERIQGV